MRGLAVFMDVVHNHYGPTDLDLWDFDGWAGTNSVNGGGIYFFESNTPLEITPWGDTRPNFSSNQVCSFVQDNFTMWLSEYHVDGFRWDTPYTIMHDNNGNYIPAAENLVNAINAMIHTNYAEQNQHRRGCVHSIWLCQHLGHDVSLQYHAHLDQYRGCQPQHERPGQRAAVQPAFWRGSQFQSRCLSRIPRRR